MYSSHITRTDAPAKHTHQSGRINQPQANFKFAGISHEQIDVDSILVPAGGRFSYEIQIFNHEINDFSISIHEHLLNGEVSEDLGPGNGITSSETISLEIRFHMIAPNDLFWRSNAYIELN